MDLVAKHFFNLCESRHCSSRLGLQ
uniref:Uncharacterized protein n=1 Tax=Rhizophora mucronata TaxID=61149 RepID=A0A2P2R043_RHIMU